MTKQMTLTDRPESTEVAAPLAPVQDVGGLLTHAIDRGITPDGLAKLLDLQERILQRNAEAEFNLAMQAFQSQCPSIAHDRVADTGSYKYTYATLSHIADTISPLLKELGLSYTFDAQFISESIDLGGGKTTERSYIRATCTVHHVAGHKRAATFQAPIDKSARMNVMQQSASALSYARRYALLLAFGITTADMDDDGGSAGRRRQDAPEASAAAPTVAPRGGRVQRDEILKLAERWSELYGGDRPKDELRAAFANWAFETAGVPKEKSFNTAGWTRDAIRSCEQRMQVDAEAF